jgi:hypothetical protein
MKTFRNESGTSMLSVLAILSMITLVAYNTLQAQVAVAKSHRNAETVSEITAYFGRVSKVLETQWSCTASLQGQNYNDAVILKDPVTSDKIIAQAATQVSPFWKLAQIQFQNVQAVAGRPGVLSADLDLQFTKDTRVQTGAPIVNKTLAGIFFSATPDGQITQCYPSQQALSMAQAGCTGIGGVWNESLPYGSQCTLPVAGPSPSPTPLASSSQAGPSGLCRDRDASFISVANSSMSITGNGQMKSDLYLLSGTNLSITGNAEVAGPLFEDIGSSFSTQGKASVDSYLKTDLGDLARSLNDFVAAKSALTPTQNLSSISQTMSIAGNGGQNVIEVAGDLSLTGTSTLTLSGSASDSFVVRVSGKITVAGSANVLLAGDLLPEHVVFINEGTGNEIVISGNGSVSGTFIGLKRGLQVSGNGQIQGAFAAGGGVNTKILVSGNGLAISPRPYCIQ